METFNFCVRGTPLQVSTTDLIGKHACRILGISFVASVLMSVFFFFFSFLRPDG